MPVYGSVEGAPLQLMYFNSLPGGRVIKKSQLGAVKCIRCPGPSMSFHKIYIFLK